LTRTPGVLLATAAAALLGGGCGGSDDAAGESKLVVFAASSLQPAFESYAEEFDEAEIEFSFAGSDTLAAQVRQGVEPDVYASADATYAEELSAAGLLSRPVAFATNRLVVGVPAGSGIASVEDVAADGVSVAIGAEGVPVGDYTREALDRLPADLGRRILENVDSEEPDVAGVVGKLTQGVVDAGFVYASDIAAAPEDLHAIELAPRYAPDISFGVGVGAGASDPELAERFVEGLLDGAGADALAAGGFGPAPAAADDGGSP
jgi:molybdate transport system substrate-binding protein